MEELNTIQRLSMLVLPVLFAVTAHESAHAWVARRLGDSTASMLGRVTLNPTKHVDPIGTILVPLFTYLTTDFLFGWAKPVPVNWRNLGNQRRDTALVALAGPVANLLMAIFWALMVYVGLFLAESYKTFGIPLMLMGAAGVLINAMFMCINLLPILPLDGGRVVNSLLPPSAAMQYSRLEPYGIFIVLALFITGAVHWVLWPAVIYTIAFLPASDLVIQLLPIIFSPRS